VDGESGVDREDIENGEDDIGEGGEDGELKCSDS